MRPLGYVWATPTTLACLLVFLLPMWAMRQVRPSLWRSGAWEWLVVPGSRFERWWVLGGRWSGVTLGVCVLFASGAAAARSAVHERRHVAQNLVLGTLFLPAYAMLWLVYRYERHPLERDARKAACEPEPDRG